MTEIFCDPLAPIALVLLSIKNCFLTLWLSWNLKVSLQQVIIRIPSKEFFFSRIYFKSIRLSSDQMLMKITGGLKKTHKRHWSDTVLENEWLKNDARSATGSLFINFTHWELKITADLIWIWPLFLPFVLTFFSLMCRQIFEWTAFLFVNTSLTFFTFH